MKSRKLLWSGSLALFATATCFAQVVDQSVTGVSAEASSVTVNSNVTTGSVNTARDESTTQPPDLTGAIGSMIASRKDLQSGGSSSPIPSKGFLGRTGKALLGTAVVNQAAELAVAKREGSVRPPGETSRSPQGGAQTPTDTRAATAGSAQAPAGGSRSPSTPSASAEISSVTSNLPSGGVGPRSPSASSWSRGSVNAPAGFDLKKVASKSSHAKAAPPKKRATTPPGNQP